MSGRFIAFAALAGASLALASCVAASGGFDVDALTARYPELRRSRGHRLGDVAPHFWIEGRERIGFLCRFASDAPVRVQLLGSAADAEREALERALVALSEATGIELVAAQSGEAAEIEFEFIDGPSADDPQRFSAETGDATADCRVDGSLRAANAPLPDPLPAQLVAARVRIRRARADGLGRVKPLGRVELLAASLHELGHALGYAAHARAGNSVMRLEPGEVRRVARAVAAGRPLRDSTLRALYALPSGAIVERSALPSEAAATFGVFAGLAAERGWSQPLSRSGEASAEIWWSTPQGTRAVLRAWRQPGSGAWQAPFRLFANPIAREALADAARRRSTR